MKVVVLQKDLAKALTYTSRFVSTRAQLPILANIALIAKGNRLTIKATNLEISISAPIGANVEEAGEIAIPSKMFTDLIGSLHTEKVSLSTSGDVLNLEAENFKGNLSGLNTSDFPDIPTTLKEGVLIPANTFHNAISKVLFSSSPDDTRPALSGVLMFTQGDMLSFVSSDGFRLSKKDVLYKLNSQVRIILPKSILVELIKICQDAEELSIKVVEGEKQILFGVGDMVLSSRLVEGEYPPFEKIIPASSSISVNVNKEEFRDTIKIAAVFARDGANVIRLSVGEREITVSAESAKSGSQEAKIAAKVNGPSIEVLFNYRYLEEFLNIIKGESIEMKFNSPEASGVFLDSSDENYLHLIMPVKN